jgi:hypothetical protein
MQGNLPMTPIMNWTERDRSGKRRDGDRNGNRRNNTGGRSRTAGKKEPRDNNKPKVICQACFVPGHEAVTCWTLARALLAHDFVINVVDRQILIQVQDNYKKRFHPPEHPRANRMCAENLWSYCLDNHTTPEIVCQQMDWTGLAASRVETDTESDDESSTGVKESVEDSEV